MDYVEYVVYAFAHKMNSYDSRAVGAHLMGEWTKLFNGWPVF